MKTCAKCKKEYPRDSFPKAGKHPGSYCKPCNRQIKRHWDKFSVGGRYTAYKSSAKKRNINWDLTKEQFETWWQVPCSYCGDEIETIGLDRIDSDEGYEEDNIVSCCSTCNYMKLDLTYDKWVGHMKKIINNLPE